MGDPPGELSLSMDCGLYFHVGLLSSRSPLGRLLAPHWLVTSARRPDADLFHPSLGLFFSINDRTELAFQASSLLLSLFVFG